MLNLEIRVLENPNIENPNIINTEQSVNTMQDERASSSNFPQVSSKEAGANQAEPEVSRLCPIFIKIALEDLVYLKSILESYDELGIIRTLNRARGEIVILAVAGNVSELQQVLAAVKTEIDFEIIPQPSVELSSESCEDWLLRE